MLSPPFAVPAFRLPWSAIDTVLVDMDGTLPEPISYSFVTATETNFVQD
jgi:hypothetical protein